MTRIFGFGLIGLVVTFTFVLWIQLTLLLVSLIALLLVAVGQLVPISRRKHFFGRQSGDEEKSDGPYAVQIGFEQARFVLLLSCVSYFFFGVVLALTLPKSLTTAMDPGGEYYYALYGFTYLSMVPGALVYRFLSERLFLLRSEAIAPSILSGATLAITGSGSTMKSMAGRTVRRIRILCPSSSIARRTRIVVCRPINSHFTS